MRMNNSEKGHLQQRCQWSIRESMNKSNAIRRQFYFYMETN